jgi:hypothetical protein
LFGSKKSKKVVEVYVPSINKYSLLCATIAQHNLLCFIQFYPSVQEDVESYP